MPNLATSGSTRVAIRLDEETYAAYERQAESQGKEVEDLIAQRLATAQNHTASQCIYFNDDERVQLGVLLGRSVSTAVQALAAVRNTMAVRCGTIKNELSQRHLQRLIPRARAEHKPPEVVAWREMLRGLEEFLGMR